MSNIAEKLDRLNPQQLAKVIKLIDKLANKNVSHEEVEVARPQTETTKVIRPKKNLGPRQAEVATLYTGKKRTNKFDSMDEKKGDGDEAENPAWNKINDKLKKPVPRGKRAENVEVRCLECKQLFSVKQSLVIYQDQKPKFTCNECLVNRGRGRR